MKRTLRNVLALAGAAIVAGGALAACSDQTASPVEVRSAPAFNGGTGLPGDTTTIQNTTAGDSTATCRNGTIGSGGNKECAPI